MKIPKKEYKYHVLAWVALAVYEISAVAVVTESISNVESYLAHYVINILLFYFHSSVVLILYIKRKNFTYILLLVGIAAEVVVYIIVNYLIDTQLQHKSISFFGPSGMNRQFLVSSIWRAGYFMVFATTYFYFIRFRATQKQMSAMEKLNSEREIKDKELALELSNVRNSYLRAQVNPHFLMNTLSFVYNKTHKTETYTAQAVLCLSKILRFMVDTEHGTGMNMIGLEIEQAENLFQLSRLKNEAIFVDFEYEENIEQEQIIPLIIISLAENMIKHGNLSDPASPGKIEIRKTSNSLVVSTLNLINTGINDTGSHTGLDNIKQRLKHTYGEFSSINFGTTNDRYFYVKLVVPLVC